jgi:hypothetical protein
LQERNDEYLKFEIPDAYKWRGKQERNAYGDDNANRKI